MSANGSKQAGGCRGWESICVCAPAEKVHGRPLILGPCFLGGEHKHGEATPRLQTDSRSCVEAGVF